MVQGIHTKFKVETQTDRRFMCVKISLSSVQFHGRYCKMFRDLVFSGHRTRVMKMSINLYWFSVAAFLLLNFYKLLFHTARTVFQCISWKLQARKLRARVLQPEHSSPSLNAALIEMFVFWQYVAEFREVKLLCTCFLSTIRWRVIVYTVSRKSSPFLFLWLLGQMSTDFDNIW